MNAPLSYRLLNDQTPIPFFLLSIDLAEDGEPTKVIVSEAKHCYVGLVVLSDVTILELASKIADYERIESAADAYEAMEESAKVKMEKPIRIDPPIVNIARTAHDQFPILRL